MLGYLLLIVVVLAAVGAGLGAIFFNRRPEEAEGPVGKRRPKTGLVVGAVVGALLGVAVWITAENWGEPNAEVYGATETAVSRIV